MSNHKGKVIVLEQVLIKSAVWLSLGATAKDVYLLLRTKCQMGQQRTGKPGKRSPIVLNNGELVFTYKEAQKKYQITPGRFGRALRELHDKGFINVAATGQGIHRVANCYAISERWRRYGQADFKARNWPMVSKYTKGFQPGNQYGRNARKNTTTVKSEHSTMYTNAHKAD